LKLVIAITGASGVIYGIRALEALKELKVETHLIMSQWGEKTIKIETDRTGDYVRSLATRVYDEGNMAAPVSSGSFKIDGMAVIPCSMKTLASIANGLDDALVSRAAGQGRAQAGGRAPGAPAIGAGARGRQHPGARHRAAG
jgi:4-hydroxy-3-polyprenylbenzoate decarboxylase